MEIFEFAMKKEKYSEDYYRQLADKTPNKGLQTIFAMLADEEAHHYVVIGQMKKQSPRKVSNTDVLSKSADVFKRMRRGADKFDLKGTEEDACRKAQEFEEQSRTFYREKAKEVESQSQKEIFEKLADEEDKHYFLLENIINFLSRPKQWLENAEFYHIEEY